MAKVDSKSKIRNPELYITPRETGQQANYAMVF